MIGLVILGATGSIGQSTLKVVDENPGKFQIIGLSAHSRVSELATLCEKYNPRYVCISDETQESSLKAQLIEKGLSEIEIWSGENALCDLARLPEADKVMSALVGAVGMSPTLAAIHAGKTVLLANKEAIVLAGSLMINAAKKYNATIIPVDSEHNAVFQCLYSESENNNISKGVTGIILTASGGPFRHTAIQDLQYITPEQACNHPNWSMGRKISVDSATMMNKGLEVIEARWLFNIQPENIEVLIHPQSIVHSMVRYEDSSVLAQMGIPDMRTPIAHAMAWPDRIPSGVEKLDLTAAPTLEFEKVDTQRFPCLSLAFTALEIGGNASARLNAANEVAVDAFLQKKISYLDIARYNREIVENSDSSIVSDLDAIIAADKIARIQTQEIINRGKR